MYSGPIVPYMMLVSATKQSRSYMEHSDDLKPSYPGQTPHAPLP